MRVCRVAPPGLSEHLYITHTAAVERPNPNAGTPHNKKQTANGCDWAEKERVNSEKGLLKSQSVSVRRRKWVQVRINC